MCSSDLVRLTFQNLVVAPNNPDLIINHAMALTLNDRSDDAAKALEKVSVGSLTPPQLANYRLAWFDVLLKRKDWRGARKQHAALDRKHLQPLQIARLDKEFKSLPPP